MAKFKVGDKVMSVAQYGETKGSTVVAVDIEPDHYGHDTILRSRNNTLYLAAEKNYKLVPRGFEVGKSYKLNDVTNSPVYLVVAIGHGFAIGWRIKDFMKNVTPWSVPVSDIVAYKEVNG